jgi:hypothetical protein
MIEHDTIELSIPLSAEPAPAPVPESEAAPAPMHETLAYDEAIQRPRPFTYRDPMSGSVVTLS